MLEVALDDVLFSYRSGFSIGPLSLTFPRCAHTAIIGSPGAGSTTLLHLISGELRPRAGTIRIGTRAVGGLRASARPVLAVPEAFPGWWSVRHALVAAVRRRTLDRVDRHHEYQLAVEKWRLATLLDRRVRNLSSSELLLTQLARVELLRPGILVADRLFAGANPTLRTWAADQFYRTLRVIGTTVITVPSSNIELGWADSVVALDAGRVVQQGSPSELYAAPADETVAAATGEVNVIPISIHGNTVESVIGNWEIANAPFQGSGVVLARPDQFEIAGKGEESDLIFGVEEASFHAGQWRATGLLSGGFALRVALPGSTEVHKGKLLPLRYEPSRFPLIAREIDLPRTSAPVDVVPPLRETR